MKPQTTREAIDNVRTEWRKLIMVCIDDFEKDIQFIKSIFIKPKEIEENETE